ncbi:hypothetical protein MARPO_0110s0042 [Marchantia polymorpha]|uniref:VWFA domain-containing protein n=1 Tax=Marchantia polymorpha TaxID=3197 RepID=A0A2R6WCH7_MARPO|nr:hypothetical protein MARPO_0110s0042 [Marchantia polymorpha]|eukprot:PTQ31553.1 hypothetical protein MARPO_0110s0042 [Marchantia polymorpha]
MYTQILACASGVAEQQKGFRSSECRCACDIWARAIKRKGRACPRKVLPQGGVPCRDHQMCRALALILVLLAVLLKDHASSVHGQQAPPAVPLAAQNFFNEAESSVESLAANAILNYKNREALFTTCNSNSRCSAYACQPVDPSSSDSQCLAMPGNIVCGGPVTNSSCKNGTVSSSSYIRLPPKAKQSDLTCDAQLSICSQKDLDSQSFEKIYSNDGGPFNKIAWSFFGFSNGVFRIYPGLELPPSDCNPRWYDPRKRPWYKAVTDVSKEVIVLLDTGGPMADALSLRAGSKVQVFSAAQQIVTEFLDTLNADDVVTVYSFDNVGTTLVNKKVQISNDDATSKIVLDPLKKAVNAITVTSNGAQANLTAALDSTVLQGGFDDSTSRVASLKIIIVITGGELADGPTVEVPPSISQGVDSQQVRTFIYQLSDSTPGTPTPGVADLSSLACTLGGSYDEVPRDNILDDPLSTLRSFYSYVASLRFALDGQKPLWVPSYADAYAIGNVITVAYPAFDGDVLIGVAAIDVLTDAVEAEWPNAIDNWRKPADKKQSQGSPVNCTVNLAPDAAVCSAGNSADRGLCAGDVGPRTDLEYNARTCCEGSCSANLLSSDAGNKTSQSFFDKGGNIALVAVPGSVVLVVLILLCFCGRKMYAACHSCVVMWLTPPPVVSPTTVMWGSDWGKEVVGMRLSFPDNSRVGGTPSTATSTTSTTQLVSSPDPSTVGSPQVATTGSRRTKSSLQGEGKDSASNNRDPWTDSL